MSDTGQTNPYRISRNRLETMVDGIFAFAMTLLVLGIEVPTIPPDEATFAVPAFIANLAPQLIIFVIAFLVLAVFWLEHHRQFHHLRIVDPVVLWLNIAILIFTVLIPFTTDLSGDYDGIQIAVVLFHVNLLAIGTLFLVHWAYLTRNRSLCDEEFLPGEVSTRIRILTIPPLCAVLGLAISFLSPANSLYAYLLIPVLIGVVRYTGKGRA